MNKLVSYLKESSEELFEKVTWPTWSELQSSAILVVIGSVIIALLVYVMDASFGSAIKLFYNMFV